MSSKEDEEKKKKKKQGTAFVWSWFIGIVVICVVVFGIAYMLGEPKKPSGPFVSNADRLRAEGRREAELAKQAAKKLGQPAKPTYSYYKPGQPVEATFEYYKPNRVKPAKITYARSWNASDGKLLQKKQLN